MPCPKTYLQAPLMPVLTTFRAVFINIKTLLPIAITTAVALSGCASNPSTPGPQEVNDLVEQRGRPIPNHSAQTLIDSLLHEPLKPETAVALALTNNHKLAVDYSHLGLGAAELRAAGQIRNPVLAAEILNPNRQGERNQLGFDLVGSLTDVLTLPTRKRLAAAEFAALRQEVGASVLATASAAERAYYEYVSAQQIASLHQQIAHAAETSLKLAERYHHAGNISPRQYALARGAAAEQILNSLAAQGAEAQARTALANVLGIAADGSWQTLKQLAEPADAEDSLKDLTAMAAESRLDLAAAAARANSLADRLRLTARTSGLGELDIGLAFERETDGAKLTGPALEWEIPAFSRNQAALMRGRAELEAAIIEHRKLAIEVENQVHLAHARLAGAKAQAGIYQRRLIPARVAATDRAQEEENFMLIGSFELIQAKQNEYASYIGYLTAVRDYWLARSELRAAVGNRLPSTLATKPRPVDVEALFRQPAPSSHRHHPTSPEETQHHNHAPAPEKGQ